MLSTLWAALRARDSRVLKALWGGDNDVGASRQGQSGGDRGRVRPGRGVALAERDGQGGLLLENVQPHAAEPAFLKQVKQVRRG